MTDLESLHAEIVDALHVYDCQLHGIDPWPLSGAPRRQQEMNARADAVMAVVSPVLAQIHLEVEQRVREEWHQWGGGPHPFLDPNAAEAYAWPPIDAEAVQS